MIQVLAVDKNYRFLFCLFRHMLRLFQQGITPKTITPPEAFRHVGRGASTHSIYEIVNLGNRQVDILFILKLLGQNENFFAFIYFARAGKDIIYNIRKKPFLIGNKPVRHKLKPLKTSVIQAVVPNPPLSPFCPPKDGSAVLCGGKGG